MAFKIERASKEDLSEMAAISARAMAPDPLWNALNGPKCTFEEKCDYVEQTLAPRLGPGVELGACEHWKVVDENGKIVAWGGFGIPVALTVEQKSKIQAKFEFPPGGNEALARQVNAMGVDLLPKHGYDPVTTFQRQGTMVDPSYQRMGLGSLLTEHMNELADKGGAPTYVRAQPKAAAMFLQMGYEVLERIDFDLKDFDVDLETKTSTFAMKRDPGAKSERGRKLDMSRWNWKGL